MKRKTPVDIAEDLAKLEAFAIEKGAVQAVRIPIDKVVIDERVYYKCLYGCPNYNSSKMCPPNTPLPLDFERALRKFQWGILVQTRPKDIVEIIVAVLIAVTRTDFDIEDEVATRGAVPGCERIA